MPAIFKPFFAAKCTAQFPPNDTAVECTVVPTVDAAFHSAELATVCAAHHGPLRATFSCAHITAIVAAVFAAERPALFTTVVPTKHTAEFEADLAAIVATELPTKLPTDRSAFCGPLCAAQLLPFHATVRLADVATNATALQSAVLAAHYTTKRCPVDTTVFHAHDTAVDATLFATK